MGTILRAMAFSNPACWILGVLLIVPTQAADSDPVAPALTETHKQFLSRLARRTLRDSLLGREVYEASYVPGDLDAAEAEVVVRLRLKGFLLGVGQKGPAPIASALRDATLTAAELLKVGDGLPSRDFSELLVEIEMLGSAEPIAVSVDWTQPGALDPYIEPGVHGMVISGSRGSRRFLPSELITSDLVVPDVLKGFAQQVMSAPTEFAGCSLQRFRTLHWIESAPSADLVTLHRGMILVDSSSITRRSIDETINRLADYMIYRQRSSGRFSYQYEPAKDRYSDDDNEVRQAGATLAVAFHARHGGGSASLAAADLAFRRHLNGLTKIPGASDAAFMATPDRRNKLGVTALFALALAAHPQESRFADLRGKLIRGALWLQKPSGIFITAFPPAERIDGQDYFPGEALLALAEEYSLRPSAEILEAFDRAIAFYRPYFRSERSPAFVPWQVQAFAKMAGHTQRQDYQDFVFELTDWLSAMQLDSSTCPWPELHGGIASYQAGRAGIATASYLEAFTDSLQLARNLEDATRASRYESVVRGAARFVMQLQVRPEEAYYVRSPQDVVWGMRTAPALNLLRIDHCQHALIALIKTRNVLFPD